MGNSVAKTEECHCGDSDCDNDCKCSNVNPCNKKVDKEEKRAIAMKNKEEVKPKPIRDPLSKDIHVDHIKVYRKKKLIKIVTIASVYNSTGSNTEIKYGATVYHNKGQWNRRNHLDTAVSRLKNCPVAILIPKTEFQAKNAQQLEKFLLDSTLIRGCCQHTKTADCPFPPSHVKPRSKPHRLVLPPILGNDLSKPELKDHSGILYIGRYHNSPHVTTVRYQISTDPENQAREIRYGATIFKKECDHDCWNRVRHLDTACYRFNNCPIKRQTYGTHLSSKKELRRVLYYLIDVYGTCSHRNQTPPQLCVYPSQIPKCKYCFCTKKERADYRKYEESVAKTQTDSNTIEEHKDSVKFDYVPKPEPQETALQELV